MEQQGAGGSGGVNDGGAVPGVWLSRFRSSRRPGRWGCCAAGFLWRGQWRMGVTTR
jgi:hypothetical protein